MATKQPSSFTDLHGNSRRPGRFSLLFMEHGEYMLSDLSVVRAAEAVCADVGPRGARWALNSRALSAALTSLTQQLVGVNALDGSIPSTLLREDSPRRVREIQRRLTCQFEATDHRRRPLCPSYALTEHSLLQI